MPDYGGPAFSVSALALALAETGAEVGLWAADQSAPITPLLEVRSAVRRLAGTAAEALDRFGQTDVLHDNGMWLLHNHRLSVLSAKRGIPRVVSTRGMLEPWAFRHKSFKKRLAWGLYQKRELKLAHCHHTTSEAEAWNLRRFRLGVPVTTIPNGVDVPDGRSWNCAPGKADRNDRRTALFLGRIYPVKGLPLLIEAWARVRPQGWRLQIAGPDEAGHQKEVQKAVCAAGLRGAVSFAGPVAGPTKESAFRDADLFVLPTHSESFGIVVAEALAHGLPVLTTTGAPWSMLPARGCGWWVNATVDGIAEGLSQATLSDSETLQSMGARGRAWVASEFGWKSIARLTLSAYEQVLAAV